MSTPTATPSLPTLTVGDDVVTLLGAHLAHVSSKSCPGTVHAVTDERCDCKGYYYRNTCRHLTAMREARAQLVDACDPWTSMTPHPVTGLYWAGYRRGWLPKNAL